MQLVREAIVRESLANAGDDVPKYFGRPDSSPRAYQIYIWSLGPYPTCNIGADAGAEGELSEFSIGL